MILNGNEKNKNNLNNNMGLQNLLNEPQRLASESERLNLELENLVLDNYRIFVENLTCSVHLRVEVCAIFVYVKNVIICILG